MKAAMQKEVKAEPKPERRFVYFGRMEKLGINSKGEEYTQWIHNGVTCVGYDFVEDGQVVIGVSFCSPEDAFSKKKARLIINQRMNAGVSAVLPVPGMKALADMNYEELVKEIEAFIADAVIVGEPIFGDDELPKIAGVRAPRWLV